MDVNAGNKTSVGEDINAKDVADYILRGKGAQGAIVQVPLPDLLPENMSREFVGVF
jgi:hypothetical protein